jgi:hypothetical protein
MLSHTCTPGPIHEQFGSGSMITVTNITFQDIRFALYVLMSGWSHSGFTTHHTHKKARTCRAFSV